MKQVKIWSIILIMSFVNSVSQAKEPRLCVWPPSKYKVTSISDYNGKIHLIIKDERDIPKKNKIKFTSQELVSYLYSIIGESFPKAKIIEDTLDSDNNNEKLTYVVHIKQYGAIFNAQLSAKDLIIPVFISGGSSRWYGYTTYDLEIIDNRNEYKTNKLTFNGEDDGKNWGGYSTAKKMLTNAFKQATDALINYLVTNISK